MSDIAGIVAAVAAILAVMVAVRQLQRTPATNTAVQQQIMNSLPAGPPSGSPTEVYLDTGADLSSIDGSVAVSRQEIRKALRTLTKDHRVQVVIIPMAETAGGLPLFFKGGIDPSLRASVAEVQRILRS